MEGSPGSLVPGGRVSADHVALPTGAPCLLGSQDAHSETMAASRPNANS